MKRTTVYLDERTELELSRMARQKERSKAELIREALEHYLACEAKPRRLPRSVGMGRSGRPDLAEHDEELLAKIFEEERVRIAAEWRTGAESR